MWDVVCAEIKRKVGKKGNDRRKNKTNGKQEAKVPENSLGWTLWAGYWGDEVQAPTLRGYRFKDSLGQGR